MRRQSTRVPTYRLHKPSGQAVVTLGGKDFYLGAHGTEASRRAYDRLVGEWQANGRQSPGRRAEDLTIAELVLAYWKHAEGYYRKGGEPTSQLRLIKSVCHDLVSLYRAEPAAEFGPMKLKAIRQRWVERGLARRTVNQHLGRLRRVFRWGVEHELVMPSVYQALMAVPGLSKGRTEAPDHPPVTPVPDEHVATILPRLPPPIASMVQLMMLTGMRPGEVLIMRPRDLDRSGPVWTYTPSSHKTEHHERGRTVFIGPKGQAILGPWIDRQPEPDGYLFRPPQRICGRSHSGPRYAYDSLADAIERACKRAGVPRWSPNRLRHNAGTAIRKQYGLEGAQLILGHAQADVTQVYAERDRGRALTIVTEVG